MKGLGYQAVSLAVGAATGQLLIAALFILTARAASPAEFGLTVLAISIGLAAVGIFDFGSNAYLLRERAANRVSHHQLGLIMGSKLLLAAITSLVGLAVLSLTAAVLLPSVAIFMSTLALQTALVPIRAARRGEIAAMFLVVERVLAFAIYALLSLLGVSEVVALWQALSAGTGLAAISALALHHHWIPKTHLGIKFINPWNGSGYFGLNGLAASAQQFDLAVLTLVSGAASAGIYGSVNRWTQPMGLLSASFSSAAVPYVASSSNWREALAAVRRASWLLWAGAAGCVVLALAADPIVRLLLGGEYLGAVPVLQVLAVGTVPALLNQPLSTALQSRGSERAVAIVFSLAVVLQLCAIGALGVWLGAAAAAWSYLFSQTLLFSLFVFLLARDVRWEGR